MLFDRDTLRNSASIAQPCSPRQVPPGQRQGNLALSSDSQLRSWMHGGAFPDCTSDEHADLNRASVPRNILLSMAIALAAAGFMAVTTHTHWLEPGGFLVSAAHQPPLDSIHF